MSRPGREPLVQESGRGDGSGRDERFECRSLLEQSLDQRQHCRCLTDARGMNPYEGSERPGYARDSSALFKAERVFLALLSPPSQPDRHERRQGLGQPAIEEGQHQPPAIRCAAAAASAAIGETDASWPKRRSASWIISTMLCSTRCRARSSPASSSSLPISIGSPHRYTPRPNGKAR